MQPKYDLDSLIKKHQDKVKQRFPGDATHVRESVSLSMSKPKKKSGFIESAKVNEHIALSLQNK